MELSQSSFIVACLLGGFVVWLAMNGRLKVYGQALWSTAPATPTPAASSGGSTIGDIANGVATVAPFLGF